MPYKPGLVSMVMLAGATASAQDLVVRIGHAAPMSGQGAAYGRDSENGVRMAIEELNAKGVSIGGKLARFELLGEDDAGDPKQGSAVAQKLCDAKVNGVVGHLNSGTTIPASAIYHQCGVPHITVFATHPMLTQAGYKTTFRTTPNDNTTDKATDFTTLLTAIKPKNPDAIFFGGQYAQAAPMLRQMEQLGLAKVKFLGGDGICNPDLGRLAGGAKTADNVICSEGGTPLEKTTGGLAWKARYDARFPNQFQVVSPHTYDATMVLVDAMTRAGSADPRTYAPELFKTDYQGVMARIRFEADGEMKDPRMTLYGYRDGRKTTLD